jgi:hypothetical protein
MRETSGGLTIIHMLCDAFFAGLPPDLELHHIVVNSWEPSVDSEQNVVLISIASVKDPSLAPKGKHTLHAYLPATEPFSIWEGAALRPLIDCSFGIGSAGVCTVSVPL